MDNVEIQKELRKMVLLAWAMGASILVYLVIAQIIRMQHQPFQGFAPGSSPSKEAFFVGSLIAFIGIRVVRNAILKGAGSDPAARLNRLRLATIASLAMTEIPAILGLVLFLLTGNTEDFYVLVALSLIAVALYYPKLLHWQIWLRKRTS